jgi:hypothetical protein
MEPVGVRAEMADEAKARWIAAGISYFKIIIEPAAVA